MSYLSTNIKYLRKSKRWNQTELAEKLNIKRGSVASYESKNVEPRLSLIVKIAKLFDVRLVDLIEVNLSEQEGSRSFGATTAPTHRQGDTVEELFAKVDPADYTAFLEKSERMQKMIDGFRIFYKMKLHNYRNGSEEPNSIVGDMENFILLLEQISSTNHYLLKPTNPSDVSDSDNDTSTEK